MTRSLALGLVVGAAAGLVAGFVAGRMTAERPSQNAHVAGGVETMANRVAGRAPAPRAARLRVTPETARGGAPGGSMVSAAPAVPPPPSKPVSSARPPPQGPQWDQWTEAQFLDALERAARGHRIEYSFNVMTHLRRRFPNARVSLALATALIEAGEHFDVNHATQSFTGRELQIALERAARGSSENRAEWAFAQTAASHANARGLSVGDALRSDLLSHDMPFVRTAGLSLAYSDPGAQRDRIRRMGASDPDVSVRAYALNVLMDSVSGMDPEAPGLLLDALANGTSELRMSVLHLVPLMGPDAADHALRLLVDEGYAAGGEEVSPSSRR